MSVQIGQRLILENLLDITWQKRVAEPDLLGKMLKECGIRFIEFPFDQTVKQEIARDVTRIFTEEGLYVSLDIFISKVDIQDFFEKNRSIAIENILEKCNDLGAITGVPVVCVFNNDYIIKNIYTESTLNPEFDIIKKMYTWLEAVISENYDNVVPLCENPVYECQPEYRNTNSIDISTNFVSLLEDTDIGICWNFVSLYNAWRQGCASRYPGDHFTTRVEQVHFNSKELYETDDYKILWREYFALLARLNYDKTVVLESDPVLSSDLEKFLLETADMVRVIQSFF